MVRHLVGPVSHRLSCRTGVIFTPLPRDPEQPTLESAELSVFLNAKLCPT
jgi:hypothetical protein